MSEDVIKSSFEQWIKYTFDDRGTNADTDSSWYDWDEDPEIGVRYIGRLFASPVEHIRAYSDDQINKTLWTLINEAEPDMYELFNEDLPLSLRVQVVKDMYTVYEKLFAPRCTNSLSAFKDKTHVDSLNPLNSICFMWWDIIPLYGKSGDSSREVLDPHCIDVMERTLHLGSIACQEGAVHGLGHWHRAYPERVQAIIDDFLKRESSVDIELRHYAQAARQGMVL